MQVIWAEMQVALASGSQMQVVWAKMQSPGLWGMMCMVFKTAWVVTELNISIRIRLLSSEYVPLKLLNAVGSNILCRTGASTN
jgi:putative heme iron utilization protein